MAQYVAGGQPARAGARDAAHAARTSAPLTPAVLCPFLPAISPHAAEVQRYAVHWATRHGLLRNARAQATFAAAKFAYLAARAYPQVSRPDVGLATGWLITTFLLDDHLETVLGRDPDRMRLVIKQIMAHMWARADGDPNASDLLPRDLIGRPLCSALDDVWRRTAYRAGPAWRARFLTHFDGYLNGNLWEAGNRAAGRVPDIELYRRMRRQSVALEVFFDLSEPLRHIELPSTIAFDETFGELRRAGDNVVAWFNDLVSWPKEAAANDPHNLVLVLRHAGDLNITDAVYAAVSDHDAELRRFLQLRAEFEAGPFGTDPAARAVLADIAHWIRGNVDWSQESGRYAPSTPTPRRPREP